MVRFLVVEYPQCAEGNATTAHKFKIVCHIGGAVVKGPVAGGTITVFDANGAEVVIIAGDTVTGPDGSYSVTFNSTPANPVAAPVRVVITGGTSICDAANCPGGVAIGR